MSAEKKALNILAADDNFDCIQMLRIILKTLGHNVTVAGDGEDTIEKLKKQEYDIILLDLQMPNLNGYDAASAIRKMNDRKAKIPIVAVTANNLKSDFEKCMECGMDDFVSKPINIKALNDVLSKWAAIIQKNDQNPGDRHF